MRSPLDPNAILDPREIEPSLWAYQCPRSGGVWIPFQSYETWKREQKDQPSAPAPATYVEEPANDTNRPALLCPETGRLLLRFRVGHGLQFHIDRSPATGGVWLDKGEWQALKQKGLHANLHLIFTASYQRQIRSAEYAQRVEAMFRERIGAKDFENVAQFKEWLLGHPARRDICVYLLNHVEHHGSATANGRDTAGR